MSGFSVTIQFEIGDTVPFLGDDLYILEKNYLSPNYRIP